MRTRWLEPLIITLGLTSIGFAGCKSGDDAGSENASEQGDGDGDSNSESAGSTMTGDGDGDPSTGDDDTTSSDTSCAAGELGCECFEGECLGDLVCNDGICSDPDCVLGSLACECNDGLCFGDLVCIEGVCLEDDGTTTDTDTTTDTETGDTGMECPNPNEMMCDGECLDVLENVAHCGECGNTCQISLDQNIGGCQDGQCEPFWSDCYEEEDGFTTCDQICSNEGRECVQQGCNQYTWMQSNSFGLCTTGDSIGNGTIAFCDTQFLWTDTHLRCCCTP